MGKARAELVLYELGRDQALGPLRRGSARMLSFYQRAPVHIFTDAAWGDVDWMISSLFRWLLFRICGQRTRWWRERAGSPPPSSGWQGSLFVIAVWSALVLAVDQVFPILPSTLV